MDENTLSQIRQVVREELRAVLTPHTVLKMQPQRVQEFFDPTIDYKANALALLRAEKVAFRAGNQEQFLILSRQRQKAYNQIAKWKRKGYIT